LTSLFFHRYSSLPHDWVVVFHFTHVVGIQGCNFLLQVSKLHLVYAKEYGRSHSSETNNEGAFQR
jgi:hypothetical protein